MGVSKGYLSGMTLFLEGCGTTITYQLAMSLFFLAGRVQVLQSSIVLREGEPLAQPQGMNRS